jgi:hypothetical protein
MGRENQQVGFFMRLFYFCAQARQVILPVKMNCRAADKKESPELPAARSSGNTPDGFPYCR